MYILRTVFHAMYTDEALNLFISYTKIIFLFSNKVYICLTPANPAVTPLLNTFKSDGLHHTKKHPLNQNVSDIRSALR